MIRVAVIEANHWHAPLYLEAFRSPGIEVVAVSDAENGLGRHLAEQLDCPHYSSYAELIGKETVDFAFAFGRPVDMPSIGQSLIDARIPHVLEKPCGIHLESVRRLRQAAQAASLYVAVPFIFRVSPLLALIQSLERADPVDVQHMSFRFIAGPPSRYTKIGCGWMLDPAISGGGPTINLAIHFIDLIQCLTGEPIVRVSATMSALAHGAQIEDFAALTVWTAKGVVGQIEAGYTFPSTADEQREFSFTVRSRRHYLRSMNDGVAIRQVAAPENGTELRIIETNTDVLYPVFSLNALGEWQAGRTPSSGLREAEAAMAVVEAAYRSAATLGNPVAIDPFD
jgi:predicted dehydrogenase